MGIDVFFGHFLKDWVRLGRLRARTEVLWGIHSNFRAEFFMVLQSRFVRVWAIARGKKYRIWRASRGGGYRFLPSGD